MAAVVAIVALTSPTGAAFSDSAVLSGNVMATDTLAPPTAVGAAGGGDVTLTWTATSDTYASGHRVLRATTSGGPYSQVAELTPRATEIHLDSPAEDTYYYILRAFAGGWESANSAEVEATVANVGLVGSWQTGLSHTSASGSDRALVFFASNEEASTSTPTLTSVTYGGQPLVKVDGESVISSGKSAGLELWLLDEAGIAAASGTTLVPTWTITPDSPLYSHAIYEHVDQVTPTDTSTTGSAADHTPNPVPLSSVATAKGDIVVAAATAGETGSYTVQNAFTTGIYQDTTVETTALGTAYKEATGSNETASFLFNPVAPPWINRQVAMAAVLNVKP